MAYIINDTRGQVVAVIEDGTIDTTSTDLQLVGRGVTDYGTAENENLVWLMENFANDTPPLTPLVGQIWYNTGDGSLNVRSTGNTWLGFATEAYVDAQKISPGFTGVPTAPTAASTNSSTQLATTAFVQAQKISPSFTGVPTAPTAPNGNSTTQIATTAFVQTAISNIDLAQYAPIDTPTFIGTPTAPSPTNIDNSDRIATTAFVQAQKVSPIFSGIPRASTAPPGTVTTQLATTAFVSAAVGGIDLSTFAPKSSPTFTGTPLAPTATTGTNTTQIATTAFVASSIGSIPLNLYAPKASPNLTGQPSAPTAPAGTNTNQLATTAFVQQQIANGSYSLPTASTSILGGVKVDGTTITATGGGVISAVLNLPTATASALGGIKVGSGLSITGSGVLSATGGGGTPTSPAGANTQVQFNNNGSFGATSNLTYNSTTKLLQINGARFGTVTDGPSTVAYVIGDSYAGIGIQTPRDVGVVLENNALRPTQLNVDSGSQAWRWRNLYVSDNFVWNGKTISAPGTSTSLFLRNDGTWATPSGGGGSYTLPTASTSTLGGVKVDGTTITINGSGVITSTATNYTLPIASSTVLGGFKVGSGLSITAGGTLSATGGGGTPTNPAGANTQVQFNNDGSFGATSNLTYDSTTKLLQINGARFGIVTEGSANVAYVIGNQYAGIGIQSPRSVGVVLENNAIRPTQLSVDSGSQAWNWRNLYVSDNFVWNGKTITAPASDTTKFLRNDGTWAVVSGGSSYTLPTASTTTLGGVKVDGTTVTINGSGVITANMQTAQGYYITGGTTETYGYTNSYSFDNSANYFDVFPPAGYTMSQFAGGTVSIAYIYFAGKVDENDALRCISDRLPDRFRVYVQNTEQRAAPSANWLAFWNNP